MLSALAVFLCDNYLVIFRLALLFLITKLRRIFDITIECADNCDNRIQRYRRQRPDKSWSLVGALGGITF